MADVQARTLLMRSLLPSLKSALESFQSSSASFRVIRTVNPPATADATKTLYVLDSSFNPPSIAHLNLARSAIVNDSKPDARPYRLLLLFSTQNADKAPSAASFEHRLALMTLFAEDLSRILSQNEGSNSDADNGGQGTIASTPIDIGLTTAPYYTDKSAAIAACTPNPYPAKPIHIHLVGYDTLIRFTAPKYYQDHTPPLSALAPFFDAGHKLRITTRAASSQDSSSSKYGTIEQQKQYLVDLRNGSHEKEGFQPHWSDQLQMVETRTSEGISSTRVRNAAKDHDWQTVGELCTPSVAAWIREQSIYEGDARGAKMA